MSQHYNDFPYQPDPQQPLWMDCRDCGLAYEAARLGRPETDREFHERIARMEDQEGALELLDARYHDHLPDGQDCRLCGIEHSAIWPTEARPL